MRARTSREDGTGLDGLIRREGEYWTVAFEGKVVRLRDTKGLHYLACLLRHPGRAFHVSYLMTAAAGDGSEELGVETAPEVHPDSDENAERVRKAVTNRIRQTVARIRAGHNALGLHLGNAVHTGMRCVYTPDRRVRWLG